MALGPNTANVVFSVSVETKAWLEREAARRGLTTSAYLRTIVTQTKNRQAAAA